MSDIPNLYSMCITVCVCVLLAGQAGKVFDKQRVDFMKDVVSTGELEWYGGCVALSVSIM